MGYKEAFNLKPGEKIYLPINSIFFPTKYEYEAIKNTGKKDIRG